MSRMKRHKVKLLRFPARVSAAWVCNFARTITGAFPSKRSIRRQMGKLKGCSMSRAALKDTAQ